MNNSNSTFSPTHISSYFFKSRNTYPQCLAKTDKHQVEQYQYIGFCMYSSQKEILAVAIRFQKKSLHKLMWNWVWSRRQLTSSLTQLPGFKPGEVGCSVHSDLASFENWKNIALDLNGRRIKPYPEIFICYVSSVYASIMQQSEK